MSRFGRWLTTDPRDTPGCPTCEGAGTVEVSVPCLGGGYLDALARCADCGGTGLEPRPDEVGAPPLPDPPSAP